MRKPSKVTKKAQSGTQYRADSLNEKIPVCINRGKENKAGKDINGSKHS